MGRVLSLFSGSLASRVATRLVERHLGMKCLSLIHFRSPFAWEIEDLRLLVRSEWPGVPFRTQSLKRDYRRLVTSGTGFCQADNCRICRTQLLSRAARYMDRIGADFIVTGEIVGRHGLSLEDFRQMDEDLGISGRVIRPLCVDVESLLSGAAEDWIGEANGVRDPDTCVERA